MKREDENKPDGLADLNPHSALQAEAGITKRLGGATFTSILSKREPLTTAESSTIIGSP